jgi:serine/threonine-protein kinase
MSTLNPEQWREVSRYLDEFLALPDAERELWLTSFRRQHPENSSLLQQLIEHHRVLSEEHFLEQLPDQPTTGSLAGQTVGAYALLRPIGQGGMGDVWLACFFGLDRGVRNRADLVPMPPWGSGCSTAQDR